MQLILEIWRYIGHAIMTHFKWDQWAIPLMVFRSNSKLDQNSQCSDLMCAQPITIKFCTSRQFYSCDMCKISLRSVEYVMRKVIVFQFSFLSISVCQCSIPFVSNILAIRAQYLDHLPRHIIRGPARWRHLRQCILQDKWRGKGLGGLGDCWRRLGGLLKPCLIRIISMAQRKPAVTPVH